MLTSKQDADIPKKESTAARSAMDWKSFRRGGSDNHEVFPGSVIQAPPCLADTHSRRIRGWSTLHHQRKRQAGWRVSSGNSSSATYMSANRFWTILKVLIALPIRHGTYQRSLNNAKCGAHKAQWRKVSTFPYFVFPSLPASFRRSCVLVNHHFSSSYQKGTENIGRTLITSLDTSMPLCHHIPSNSRTRWMN